MSNDTATGYQGPRRSGGGSIRDRATKFEENPFKILPKLAKEVGEEFRFRILSLDPADTRQIEFYRVPKWIQKLNKDINVEIEAAMLINEPVEVMFENDLAGLTHPSGESQGMPVVEGKTSSKYRIPIWLYDKSKPAARKGGAPIVEPIGRVCFTELSWGQFNDLCKLEEDRNLDLTFDEETGKPMYDIVLYRNAASGTDTYQIFGLQNAGGALHPNYDVDDEVAIGAEGWKTVLSDWAAVQEAMNEFQSMERIRKELGTSTGTGAISQRPQMPGGGGNQAAPADAGAAEQQVEADTNAVTPRTRRGAAAATAVAPPEDTAAPEDAKTPEAPVEVDTQRPFGIRRRGTQAAAA